MQALPVHPAIAEAAARMPAAAGAASVSALDVFSGEGQLTARAHRLGEVLQGPLTLFHTNGAKAMEATYQQGVPHGVMRVFDESGGLLQSSQRTGGQIDGVSVTYYPSGQKMQEQTHVLGVLHGETVMLAESGDVLARLPYVTGRLHGEARYYQEGRLVRKERYSAGVLDGAAEDFTKEGIRSQLTPYQANVIQGLLQRYWPNGQLMEEVMYRNGKPVTDPRCFGESGQEILKTQAVSQGLFQSLERLVKGG